LIPSMAQDWGGASAAGWLYSAMPLGSIFISLLSGRSHLISRHGKAVILSATFWGVAIFALGFAPSLKIAIFCLAAAGAADAVSALYRSTIWNQTIPASYRGRLAGVEMLSYMTGPLIGNARAGYMASYSSNYFSIVSGGFICIIACLACIFIFPKFWKYDSHKQS
jgi:MFS family permease